MRLRDAAVLLVWTLLGVFHGVRAQTPEELNLGFEQAGEKPSKPKAWTVSGDGFATDAPGYQVGLDEAEAKSGKRSLRMKSTGQGSFGNAYLTLPGSAAAGKHVKISGWIKTKDVAAKGYAGLWCRIDGPGGMLAHDNMAVRIDAKGKVTPDDRGVRGTTDWKLYSVEHDVPSIGQGHRLRRHADWRGDGVVGRLRRGDRRQALPGQVACRTGGRARAQAGRAGVAPQERHRLQDRAGRERVRRLAAAQGDRRRRPHRRAGRGHARHGRVLPHEAPARRVPRLGDGLHLLRHRGQHARGVPRQRLRPERQRRPEGPAPRDVLLDVGHAGSARHDPLDEEVQRVGQGPHPVPRVRHADRGRGGRERPQVRRRGRPRFRQGGCRGLRRP